MLAHVYSLCVFKQQQNKICKNEISFHHILCKPLVSLQPMYFIAKYSHEILVRQMRRSFLNTENYQFPTYIIRPLLIHHVG